MKNSIYKNEIFLGMHVILAFVLMNVPKAGIYYAMLIVGYGFYRMNLHKNKDNFAICVAGYLVGSEVLLRLVSSSLSYEFGKYGTILFLVVGMRMATYKKPKPKAFVIFILLLLPSLLVINYPTFDLTRQMVSFNISGPLCLGVSAIYFYKRKVTVVQLRKMFLCIICPIVTMLIVISFRSGSLEDIEYTTESNFKTSGGFGPNQVSTIFGLGVLIIAIAYFMNIRLFRVKYLELFLMFAFMLRGLATFSRGGVLAPIVAIVLCVIIMSFTDAGFQSRISKMVYALILIFIVTFLGFNYVNDVSGGLLEMRFKGESMFNKEKSNLFSGRDEIFKEDYDIFLDNVLIGVGPGMAAELREENYGTAVSAHIEYSRLLAEHGLFGLGCILIILLVPVSYFFKLDSTDSKVLLIMCVSFTFVTMGHAAMRTAAPGFVYGMAFLTLIRKPTV